MHEFKDTVKDKVGAVIHDDGTGRLQTVSPDECPEFYDLIHEFYKITGVPILLNTSFNDIEPIVETPEDALITFLRTDIDVLAIERFMVFKSDLPATQCETISDELSKARENRISTSLASAKTKYFVNYSQDSRDQFLKEEKLQAEWHLKYRAKYEIECFIERATNENLRVLLVSCRTTLQFSMRGYLIFETKFSWF